jgi:hypothetical protein
MFVEIALSQPILKWLLLGEAPFLNDANDFILKLDREGAA